MIDRRLACLVLALIPLASRADVQWRYDVTGDDCGDLAGLVVEVKGPSVRIDTTMGGQRSGFLYDGIEEMGYGLDHERKLAVPMALDADTNEYRADVMQAAGHKLDKLEGQRADAMRGMPQPTAEQLAQMQQMMADAQANLPADQRADPRMQQQMADAMAMMQQHQAAGGSQRDAMRAITASMRETVVETGERETIAGVDCAWRERQLQGETVARECVAKPDVLVTDAADRRGMERFMRAMKQLGAGADAFIGDDGKAKAPPDDGLAVRRVCIARGAETGRATLVVTHDTRDASRFVVPEGYGTMSADGSMPSR